MIIIEFQLNQSVVDKHREIQFAQVDAGVIEETFFFTPIRMQVNELELFEDIPTDKENIPMNWIEISQGKYIDSQLTSSPWMEIPLIGFAMDGHASIKQACSGRSVRFFFPDIGEYLEIAPISDDTVRIYSSINRLSTDVKCEELIEKFSFFVLQVKEKLNKYVPEIRNNLTIRKWLEDRY